MIRFHREGVTPDYYITIRERSLIDLFFDIYGENVICEIDDESISHNGMLIEFDKLCLNLPTADLTTKIQLLNNIIFESSRAKSDYIVLHSGAVQSNEGVTLFLGETTSGKSTLVYYLVNNGYNYVSDDIVPISVVNNTAEIIGNPIHLRSDSINVLKSYGVANELNYCEDIDRFIYQPLIKSNTHNKVNSICIINRGHKNNVSILSKAEIFRTLLINSKTKYIDISTVLKYVLNLEKDVIKRAYRIEYSDMNYVLKVLQDKQVGSR